MTASIRKATLAELDAILAVYDEARAFMRKTGNATQWSGGYPSREVIAADIQADRLYVYEDDNGIGGVFVFFVGNDTVYAGIDGDWGSGATVYGVMHRVAVVHHGRGIGRELIDYAFRRSPADLRIDTHADNRPMRSLLAKCGFTPCGTVDYGAAGKRIAYRKTE
jgi:RimJ/RimL family protein N-acetyltransferase